MLETILEFATQYGLIAVLYVWLLHTVIKNNETRELKYQQTIEKNQGMIADAQKISIQLSEELKTFTYMSKDIKEIKDTVIRIKEREN